MKKFLLGASILAFMASLIIYWVVGSVGMGILMTILIGASLLLAIFLFKNSTEARPWIVIVLVILAIIFMRASMLEIAKRNEPEVKITVVDKEDSEARNNCVCEKKVQEDDEDEFELSESTEPETVDEAENLVKDQKTEVVSQEKEVIKEPVVVEKKVVEQVIKEVPVVKTVVKEVPVEKQVIKEVVKEVPAKSTTTQTTTLTPTYNYSYGYSQDPTGGYNYGYEYGYGGYTGDPTGGYNYGYDNNSNTSRIEGPQNVKQGRSYSYTIRNVSRINESQLKLPYNVSVENISGNRVTLYFENGYTGVRSIGYGNDRIDVKVAY